MNNHHPLPERDYSDIVMPASVQQLVLENAVLHGKFEITSNILHDIGNALVGLGSYLNRISHSLEQNDPENLRKLSEFFVAQQESMKAFIGEPKSSAVIKMLDSLAETQIKGRDDIKHSVSEQLHILTHIKEILIIQRQYLAGQEPNESKSADLGSIVNDCLAMLYASIEKRGISVIIDISEGLPAIYVNRTRLMQVILNILKNSMEAIPLDTTSKEISISAFTEKGGLVLQVKDSGQGFDKTTGDQLFSRGFTTKSYGTGLGLGHCRSILEEHKGTILLKSDGPGKGAETTMRFPVKKIN
jgi:signal transduction histidine kinase